MEDNIFENEVEDVAEYEKESQDDIDDDIYYHNRDFIENYDENIDYIDDNNEDYYDLNDFAKENKQKCEETELAYFSESIDKILKEIQKKISEENKRTEIDFKIKNNKV